MVWWLIGLSVRNRSAETSQGDAVVTPQGKCNKHEKAAFSKGRFGSCSVERSVPL